MLDPATLKIGDIVRYDPQAIKAYGSAPLYGELMQVHAVLFRSALLEWLDGMWKGQLHNWDPATAFFDIQIFQRSYAAPRKPFAKKPPHA
jgi:hypothetical protein